MELSTAAFSLVLFFIFWIQISIWSFYFNLATSCIAVTVFLYLVTVHEGFFPIEALLMHVFYKGSYTSEKEACTQPGEANSVNTFDDEITRKLRELTGHIVRDFILDWYNTVSDDVHFVQEAFELFEHVFTGVRMRVSSIDSQRCILIVLRRLTRHLSCYKQAVLHASTQPSNDANRREQLIILTYEKLHGHLAMSNLPDTETDHMCSLTAVLLKALLPKDYRLTGTSLYLVRELISRNVLLSLINMLSDPPWINGMIVRILKDDIEEDISTIEESENESSDSEDITDTNTLGDSNPSIDNSSGPSYIKEEFVDVGKNPRDVKITYSASAKPDELNLDISYHTESNNNNLQKNASLENVFAESTEVTKPNDDLLTAGCTEDSVSTQVFDGLCDSTTSISSSMSNVEPLPMAASLSHFNDYDESETSTEEKPKLENKQKNDLSTSAEAGEFPNSTRKQLSVQEDRFFQHIRIPETVTMEESFEGGSKYTLYKIDYCAPAPPPKRTFKSAFSWKNGGKEESSSTNQPHPMDENKENELQHFQVQRRFREFLTLQDRLNEKQLNRKLIRNVKGPSRMFPMPIGNMDKGYIEKRRKFLQAYLRELCSFPHINKTSEMREFLAYNADPRIAYVRRPSDYIPRFDKMLKNVVQDFLGSATDKISSKFTSFENDDAFYQNPPSHAPQSSIISSKSMPIIRRQPAVDGPLSNREIPSLHGHSPSKSSVLNPVARLKNMVLGKSTNISVFEEGLRDYSPFTGPRNANDVTFGRNWRSPENLLNNRTYYHRTDFNRRRQQGDGCDQLFNLNEGSKEDSDDYSLSGQIFCLVRRIWNVSLGQNTLLFLSLCRYVKEYINLRVNALTQKDKWLQYLKTMQNALWPAGVWGGDKETDRPVLKEDHLSEAQEVLEETFPDALPYVVGSQQYKAGVAELLESFQNPVINRHLIYHLLDLIVQMLFPDLQRILSTSANVSL